MKHLNYLPIILVVATAPVSKAAVIQVSTGGTTDPGLSGGGTISDLISIAVDQPAFTTATLWDGGTSTVGGGSVAGSLVIAFEMTPLDRAPSGGVGTPTNAFSGGQLYNNNGEKLALGNSWAAWAYSYFGSGSGDVNGGGNLLLSVNTPILGIMNITYNAGADDNVTIKVSDDGGATYHTAALTGDYSFDEFRLRSGHDSATANNRWEWSNVAFATGEAEAIAAVPEPSSTALLGLGGLVLMLRHRK